MLTNTEVGRAKPLRQARKLTDGRGLYLLVAPNGGRYWRYNYRFDGKQKTLALGVCPDVSLATARTRHQEARRQQGDRNHLRRKTHVFVGRDIKKTFPRVFAYDALGQKLKTYVLLS